MGRLCFLLFSNLAGLCPYACQVQGKGQIFVTEYRGRVGSFLHSYSEGLGFEFWPEKVILTSIIFDSERAFQENGGLVAT